MTPKLLTAGLTCLAVSLALPSCGAGTPPGSPPMGGSGNGQKEPKCDVKLNPITKIAEIQGDGATSPLVDQKVNVQGVVTADFQGGLGGFFIEELKAGGDPEASRGVYVYTGSAPQAVKPGDFVQLSATVTEYRGKSDQLPGTVTELTGVGDLSVCGSGLTVEPAALTLPATASDLEKYEGMLVSVPQQLSVTDNYGLGRYGELSLSVGGRLFNPTNGNTSATEAQNDARRILLDDGNTEQNPAPILYLTSSDPATATRRVGDTVQNLTGVLYYAFDSFVIEPVGAPNFVASNPRPAAPAAVDGSLKVAGANVLNFFNTFGGPNDRGADSAYEFARQKAKIVAELRGLDADIVTLMEVENDGDSALHTLVDALNNGYGKSVYAAIDTGVIGTDAIKVAMIYKPERVAPLGLPVIDDNADGVDNRPPLAQTFQDKAGGGVLTVVANHLKSKGSCPKDATDVNADHGQGCWNVLRVQQAGKLLKFAARLSQTTQDQDVLLMGDFNAYGAEDPVAALKAGGFTHENLRIPALERYSYVFKGESGSLDHAFASVHLDGQITGITEWHINSDEPVVLDYNVEYKQNPECKTSTCSGPDLYAPTPYRASDHDPVLIGLNLKRDMPAAQPLAVRLSGDATATAGQPYGVSIQTSRAPDQLTLNWGDGKTDTLAAGATSAQHTYAAAGSFTVTATATAGGETASATQALTVQPAPVTVADGPWINELHYDNLGADVDEFVEVVVPDGYDAANLRVFLYNGSGGAAYGNTAGYSLDAAGSTGKYAFSVLSLPANGLQNGSPDGVALCDGDKLIQFLSYEGSFAATGTAGCAVGQTSADIGVQEDGSNAVGTSLQLSGSGSRYADFTWAAPAPNTKGQVNTGQTLQ